MVSRRAVGLLRRLNGQPEEQLSSPVLCDQTVHMLEVVVVGEEHGRA
jgi:hypothetical protein